MRLAASLSVLITLTIAPFLLAGDHGWSGQRPFPVELGSTLGISALAVLAIVVILPTRIRAFASLGADAAVRLHRHLVEVLLALLAGHIVLALALQPSRYTLLEFFGAPWRAQAAVASTACLIALIGLSVWRRRMGISYAGWRALHGGLAAGSLTLAAIHTYGWHRYLVHGGGWIALAMLTVLPLGALAALRLRRRSRSEYVLDDVLPEGGRSTTLMLRASDNLGHDFEPGQFAWLRRVDGTTRFAEHPFSYTTSAEDPTTVGFTVRSYTGFSAEAGDLALGTRFHVDGPHGGFKVHRRSRGVVLLAYGIGITPSMSILRTAVDRGDSHEFFLFYANRHEEDVTFAPELEDLGKHLDLRVVHVLSRPPAGWAGESGRIDAALLERHLPDDLSRCEFFLCGAGGSVDSGVAALVEIGVPPEHVHSERFVEV